MTNKPLWQENTYINTLADTLSIQTSSGKEDNMIAYIKQFIADYVPDAKVKVKNRNVYVTKGQADYYPCVVAHTDTVHDIYEDFGVYRRDDVLFAFSNDVEQQGGIGGDDKVGVWIGLQMLRDKDILKCAFFHSEEIGCVGSSAADMSFFKDVGYCFQSDRRGSHDFIRDIYGVELFSEDFSIAISQTLNNHSYKETSGALTDVYQLKLNGLEVCVANMSSGYYAPHSDKEVVDIADAINCFDLISNLIDVLGCNLYHHKPNRKEISFKKRKKKNPYSWEYDFDYEPSYWYDEVDELDMWNSSFSTNKKKEKEEDIGDLRVIGSCEYCLDEVYGSNDMGEDYGYCNGCDCLIGKDMIESYH